MAKLLDYPHMEFSRVTKIALGNSSVCKGQQSGYHGNDKGTFCSDVLSVGKHQVHQATSQTSDTILRAILSFLKSDHFNTSKV
jgi:hypothetical protein